MGPQARHDAGDNQALMYGLEDADCPVNLLKLTTSIKRHEGCRLIPYRDTQGFLTVGWGRNLSTKGISQHEADFLLDNDILSCIRETETQPWWNAVKDNDARARAMVELIFNLGLPKLRTFRKALAALGRRDFETASVELLRSLWARQVKGRAETLAAMVLTGRDQGASPLA